MKRSKALDEIIFILDKEYDELDRESIAEVILSKLEQVGIIDSSQFGSICSRCNAKSWDEEC